MTAYLFLPTFVPRGNDIVRHTPSDIVIAHAIYSFKECIKKIPINDWLLLNAQLCSLRSIALENPADLSRALNDCVRRVQFLHTYFRQDSGIVMNGMKYAMYIVQCCLNSDLDKAKYMIKRFIECMNIKRHSSINMILYKAWVAGWGQREWWGRRYPTTC